MRHDDPNISTAETEDFYPPIANSEFDTFVINAYRSFVVDAGGNGTKVAEVTPLAAQAVAEKIAAKLVDLPLDLIERLARQVIERHDRSERRRSAVRLADVLAVINGDTILDDSDPILDAVAVIGGGLRKAWRHVNSADIAEMWAGRVDHAADATDAAKEFGTIARPVMAAINSLGPAGTIGQIQGLS